MTPLNKDVSRIIDASMRSVIASTSELMFIKDRSFRYLCASRAFSDMLGLSEPEQVAGLTDFELFADQDLARRYRYDDERMLRQGEPLVQYIEPIPSPDGGARYSSTSKYIIYEADGVTPLGIFGVGRDVTWEYDAKKNCEQELAYLFDLPPDALSATLFDVSDWRIVDVRSAKGDVARHGSVDDFLSEETAAIADGDEARRYLGGLTREGIEALHSRGKRVHTLEYSRRAPGECSRWVRNEIYFLTDPVTGHLLVMSVLRDIDASMRSRRALIQAADTDAMTGVLNREATMRNIECFLLGEGAERTHALFMIDVDNFKQVNDTFGHQMGDSVLTDIASVIRRCFRESDIIGRVGGDEFFAFMKNTSGPIPVKRKAVELIEALQYVCSTMEVRVELSGSVGISIYEGDGKPLSRLYAEADAALYSAKQRGKNGFEFFGSEPELPEQTKSAGDHTSAVRLRTLLDNMDGDMYVAEVKGDTIRITYANQNLPQPKDAQLTDIFSSVHPEDAAELRRSILCASKNLSKLTTIYRVCFENGDVRWRCLRSSPMPDVGDGITRLIAVSTDITEAKKKEEQLAFAEMRYRTAVEQSNLLLWSVDLRNNTLSFSGSGASIIGCRGRTYHDPLAARLASGAIHPESEAEFRRMYEDMYAGREGGEYIIVTRGENGAEYAATARFQLLRDERGEAYCAIGTSVPLMQMQELTLYRTMSHGGVFSIRDDDDYTLIYGNDSFFTIHGYTRTTMREQLSNKVVGYIYPDDLDIVRAGIRAAEESDEKQSMWVMRVITGSGEIKYTQISATLMQKEGEPNIVNGVVLDVTEQKLFELSLEKQKTVLSERYDSMLMLRDNLDLNTVASSSLNLTKNLCYDSHSPFPYVYSVIDRATADERFESVNRQHVEDGQRSEYEKIFTREALMSSFEHGKTLVSIDHRLLVEPERSIWVRSNALMTRNPETGDIEALLYTADIDGEKNARFTIDRLLDTDYEFICRVFSKTGMYVQFSVSSPPGIRIETRAYAKELAAAMEEIVSPAFRDEALRALSLDNILSELEKRPVFTCVFPAVNGEGSGERFKQWKCCWLDASHTWVLITRADVTDLYSAETDKLTGLLNRQAFCRHARERLNADRYGKYVILRCDIDRFKAYNDMFGTVAGDKLLYAIGRLLSSSYPNGIVGRLESDHFIGLFQADELQAEKRYEELTRWLEERSPSFKLTLSVGLYEVSEPELDVAIMCDRALLALRSVKSKYSSKLAWYSDDMRARLIDEKALLDDAERAFREEQFEVYFQPQVNYDENSLIGAEALVRWKHPERGLLQPSAFIPLFEKQGFIFRLDAYVWEKSCQYIRRWLDNGRAMPPISVSVNVSRLDIYDTTLCERLEGLVKKYSISPSAIKLEITESAYMETPEQLIRVLKRLHEFGFTVEMDDFGSGYSSLNVLKDVPVDILKLDVRFLSNGEDDVRGGSILASVIRMAHWLKLPVIAEGVETKPQADYLKSLSCIYMQGFYFGRPMPAEDFERLLDDCAVGLPDRYGSAELEGVAAFWNPSVQMTLLFNSFVGGAAVVEYNGGTAWILRANDKFFEELGTTRTEYLYRQQGTLTLLQGGSSRVFNEMLESAVSTGDEAECEIRACRKGEETPLWTHNRVRLLAKNGGAYLFYLLTENITERKRAEDELRISREALRMAAAQMGRVICTYDVRTRTITVPDEYAKAHGIDCVIRSVPDELKRFAGEAWEKFAEFYDRIIRGERNGSEFIRVVNADGSCSWEYLSFVTAFSECGEPVSAVVTVDDVAAQ